MSRNSNVQRIHQKLQRDKVKLETMKKQYPRNEYPVGTPEREKIILLADRINRYQEAFDAWGPQIYFLSDQKLKQVLREYVMPPGHEQQQAHFGGLGLQMPFGGGAAAEPWI